MRRALTAQGRDRALARGALTVGLVALLHAGAALAREPVAIWYRSGEGCPDADAFLLELERRATPARLAGMGDPIDFVVTLGTDGSRGWGRVERQTERGTVALRELEAATCEAVAPSLALSLVLAIEPEAVPGAAPPPAPAPGAAPPVPGPTSEPAPAAPAASGTQRAGAAAGRAEPALALTWAAGAAVSMGTQLGAPAFGGGPFVELALRPGEAPLGLSPALRVSGFATLPRGVTEDVSAWLLGGRVEVCPWVVRFGAIELSPCAGAELAALEAEREAPDQPEDTSLWAALAGHGRAAWLVTGHLALEAQAGVSLALGRHDFIAETPPRVVARTDALGFTAGLGASVRFP